MSLPHSRVILPTCPSEIFIPNRWFIGLSSLVRVHVSLYQSFTLTILPKIRIQSPSRICNIAQHSQTLTALEVINLDLKMTTILSQAQIPIA